MTVFLVPASERIWDQKYRFKRPDGTPVDKTIEDTWVRVAGALAAAERSKQQQAHWENRFCDAMSDFRFLPAGRILAGAGTDRAVTLFNCFVMGVIDDDMSSIFQHLREAALTMQQGGGIGYDFSTLRPRGAPVRGVAADASGPVSFMEVWDAMCRTIMSAGSRRGAMMATLRCDHPDIEEFVSAKTTQGRLTNFNLSVLVTDSFMRAVAEDSDWDLVFGGETVRTVKAADLWDRIMRTTYDYAEPGVIFIDRINRMNNLAYCEGIHATNPCGEQPLPPYGACLLGSVNLAALVRNPFTEGADIDRGELEQLVADSVRMMDNVTDISRFPLPEQAEEAQAKRRIGLGVTGLADALAMCGVRYGSDASLSRTEAWLGILRDAAYRTSVELASEKGAFPRFDPGPYLAGETVRTLDEALRKDIGRYGIRNALLTSIAPTGTISLLANNVSSGIEPVFALEQVRKILRPDGTHATERLRNNAYRMYLEGHGDQASPPDSFVDIDALTANDHLAVQAAAQKFVDSSISKTINLAEDVPYEAFKSVYRRAYELGCKGCTTYRPNPVRGAVLEAAKPDTDTADSAPDVPAETGERGVAMADPLDRPGMLTGFTYKIRWPESDHAIYITVNDIEQDGRRRPFEVFINSKNMEHYAWTVALTRMISAVFRRGGDVSFVVEELKAVFDPRGGYWMAGRYVPSLLAAIGETIEQHMIEIGFLAPTGASSRSAQGGEGEADAPSAPERLRPAGQCPKCGAAAVVHQEGCDTCMSCGWSRCG